MDDNAAMVVRGSSSKPKSPLLPRANERFSDDKGALARAGEDVRVRALDARDDLDGELAYQSSPSALDVSVSASDESLDFDGRDLGATFTRGDGGASLSVSGGLATGSAWAGVTSTDEQRSVDVGASLAKGWVGGSGGVSWATLDGGASSLSGGAGWYPGGLAVDAAIAHTTKDERTVRLGAMGFFDADREVKDLGAVDGEQGRRRIELRRSTGTSGTFTPGAAGALLGVGGRLGAGKERAVVYRTTVSDERARALVLEEKGVVGWLRDKARALELADDPIVVPDVRDPTTLAPGDELVTTVSGSFTAGLFIGGLPLRVGAQGVLQGDFQLGVRRLDEHRLEVVVTPTSVKALQARVGAPWLLEGDLGRAECAALTQGFVFDLREPGARAAYDKVFDGELPGGLPNQVKGRRKETRELARALETESLPSGVKRSFVDQVELKRSHKGVSVSFALWFKGGSFPGLGTERASVEERRVRLDRRGTVASDTRGVERKRQVLLSGDEGRGVYASLARRTTFDDEGNASHRFDGLTLTLKLADSKVRGRELDDEVIGALNEAFGLALPKSERDGRKKSREVTVTRTLSAEDLERLARTSDDALRAALAGTTSPEERARAVQSFVARGGLDAMGAIVRALGSSVVIDTSSGAYDEPVEKAWALALRYPEPVAGSDDNATLAKRFDAGAKALREVQLGLEDLGHDPLVDDDARAGLEQALLDAKATLERALSLRHLSSSQCSQLIERLERGWTTGAERRVIEALEQRG